MNPTFELSASDEAKMEPWRLQGITRHGMIVPLRRLERTSQAGVAETLWRVDQERLQRLERPTNSVWNNPESDIVSAALGRVLTGVATNKPFSEIEGFYLDAINHGLDWSTVLFRVGDPVEEPKEKPHSLLSWAVQHQNLRVVKRLTSLGHATTTPVNALARAAHFDLGSTSVAEKIAVRLAEHSTPDDLNQPDRWHRATGTLTQHVVRYPVILMAVEHCEWALADALIEAGSAPNVHIDGSPTNTLMESFHVQKLMPTDQRGWAVYRKALALSEQEILQAEVHASTAEFATVRPRPRL